MKGRNSRWKTETQRRCKITAQRCWEKNMDNSTVLGLVPEYVLSWSLELEANTHWKEPEGWLCSSGWDGPHHPQCQHRPCLTLFQNLWCLGEFLATALPCSLAAHPEQHRHCRAPLSPFWKLNPNHASVLRWDLDLQVSRQMVPLHSGSRFSPLSCAAPWVASARGLRE